MRTRRVLLTAALPAILMAAGCGASAPAPGASAAPQGPATPGSGQPPATGATTPGSTGGATPGSTGGSTPGSGSGAGASVFPGASWARTDAAAQGFDPAALEAIADTAAQSGSNCLVVTRRGQIVGEWYWNGTTAESVQEVFSATKSFSSTLVGLAQADGKLKIADSASTYISEWKGTPAEAITVRNLLANDSGRHWDFKTDYSDLAVGARDKTQFAIDLGIDAAPGKVWAYNNAAIQTLDRVLTKALGRSPADYAEEKLFAPIGMDRSTMRKDASGNTLTFMGLQSSCEDMARFGLLFLRQGNWNGSQVVPADWVKEATTSSQQLNEAYGYLWWLNRRGNLANPVQPTTAEQGGSRVGQMVEGAPENAYFALGLGNQHIAVFPDEEVVAVRLGSVNTPKGGPDFGIGELAKVVTQALKP